MQKIADGVYALELEMERLGQTRARYIPCLYLMKKVLF